MHLSTRSRFHLISITEVARTSCTKWKNGLQYTDEGNLEDCSNMKEDDMLDGACADDEDNQMGESEEECDGIPLLNKQLHCNTK